MISPEREQPGVSLPVGGRRYQLDNLTSSEDRDGRQARASYWFPVELESRQFLPNPRARGKPTTTGIEDAQGRRPITRLPAESLTIMFEILR